ncbi:hypothetical protein [Azospirillum sp. B510]|uniref:hypothetical protein n=1 Tax=Azospirillum sp. (strain B510) TaxID=137722 RepID=UPI0005AB39E6|nr:hypothetical protein [Azospirillum sp. B510]
MPPAGDLHEISFQIGQIQAEIENARRSREVTHLRLDAIQRQLEELALLARDVAAMKPEVAHYSDARRRAAGAMAVLTLLAGGIGAAMSEIIKLFLHR